MTLFFKRALAAFVLLCVLTSTTVQAATTSVFNPFTRKPDKVSTGGGGGSTALSDVTSATGGNSLSNGDNQQIWGWALTTSGAIGYLINETSASTAAGTPYLVKILTLAASTANPFAIFARGTEVLRVNTIGQFLFSNGTFALPRISWLNDATTGIYLVTAGVMAFTSGGISSFEINVDRQLKFLQTGTAAIPQLVGDLSNNTGLYWAGDVLNIAIAGAQKFIFNGTNFESLLPILGDSNATINQGANGDTVIAATRKTDTSPTGNFLLFKNAAAATLFQVTIAGIVSAGTWQGTAIGTAYGGTGQSTTATSGRYLKGDGTNWGTSSGSASGTGACGANNWASTLNSDAAPTCTQPAFTSLSGSATLAQLPAGVKKLVIGFSVDGGGSPITAGTKRYVNVPYACTISKATVILDQTGSIVVDVWKLAFSTSALPTVANTITASAKPTVSSAKGSQDSTLTGWTTSISANDTVGFNVDSATTATTANVQLECDL